MNVMKQLMTLAVVSLILVGCTASVRVMPTVNDVNRVVARDIEKHKAEKAAFKAAVAYCENRGKEAVFISEKVAYEGTMDEDQRTSIRNHSKAAAAIGGVIRAADHQDAAVVFESAGAAGTTMTSGRDYTSEITFKCRLS